MSFLDRFWVPLFVAAFLLALFAVCLTACGQLTPEMQKHIAQCAIAYQRCVSSSQTRDEYEACRAGVDAQCVDGGGAQ